MKIFSNITTQQGSVIAQLRVHQITPGEQARFLQFNELEVDFGGEFDGADSSDEDLEDVDFDLPGRVLNVPSSLPVSTSFAIADYDDAHLRARLWVELCLVRVSTALAALNALASEDEGDELHTLPLA